MNSTTKSYIKNLLPAQIHTVQVTTSFYDPEMLLTTNGLTLVKSHIDELTGEVTYDLKYNASRHNKDWQPLTAQEYIDSADECLKSCGCDNYYISRIDTAIDNLSNEFDTALKLNRYLLTAICAAYNSMRNNYETRDFITTDNLNCKIASMTGDIQVEYYNKTADSNRKRYKTPITSRLEFRLSGKLTYEHFKDFYIDMLRKATKNLELAEQIVNEKLLSKYRDFKSNDMSLKCRINRFIIANADYIYSKRQMIDLLMRLDTELSHSEALDRATHLKSAHSNTFEFFSKSDMVEYTDTIIKKLISYGERA